MNPVNVSVLTGKLYTEPSFIKNKKGEEFAFTAIMSIKRNYKQDGRYLNDFIPVRYEGIPRMKFAHMLHKGDILSVTGCLKSNLTSNGYRLVFLIDSIQFTPKSNYYKDQENEVSNEKMENETEIQEQEKVSFDLPFSEMFN